MNKGLSGIHYMIDLETLSTKTNAVILSIGIIEFDILTGNMINQLYETIDIQSCLDKGLEIDANTLKWWLSQPDIIRLEINKKGSKSIEIVLTSVSNFLSKNKTIENFFVWGNGSSFDLSILSNAYHKCSLKIPWKFWNERDVRTIVSLAPDIKDSIKNKGILHNPIDDCKYQIEYCSAIIKHIFQN